MNDDPLSSPSNPVKIKSVDRDELKEDDFLLCSLTVLGFSLDEKMWLEFAVADIIEIGWNHSLLDRLAIKPAKKAHPSSYNVLYEPSARPFL